MSIGEELDRLSEYLEIDLTDFDSSIISQAQLSQEVGDLYAQAKYDYGDTKIDAETLCAAKELDVRANPESYELTKTTEATIHAVVATLPEVISAKKATLASETILLRTKSLYDAFAQKKSMIETEGKLMCSGLHSEPKMRK